MTITCEAAIEGTEALTPTQAHETMCKVQSCLAATLRPKVALLTQLQLGPEDREQAQANLAGFCDGSVRAYLDTCDRKLYAAAVDDPGMQLLVLALRTSAAAVRRHLDALPNADEVTVVTSLAESIDALLTVHLAIERAALLPNLGAADLCALARELPARLGCAV